MFLTRHVVAAGFVLALGAPALAQDIPPSPIVIDGKFDTATDLLLIPVRIGAARLWCAPDTGLSGLLVVDPAHAAGLAVGAGRPYPDGMPAHPDVDGSRADSLTLVALRNLLSKPGETRLLAIERAGEKLAIALPLTKRL